MVTNVFAEHLPEDLPQIPMSFEDLIVLVDPIMVPKLRRGYLRLCRRQLGDKPRHVVSSSFVKDETSYRKEGKASVPRPIVNEDEESLVQGALEFHLVEPFLLALTLTDWIGEYRPILKGLDNSAKGRWVVDNFNSIPECVAWEFDGANNDANIQTPALNVQNQVLHRMFTMVLQWFHYLGSSAAAYRLRSALGTLFYNLHPGRRTGSIETGLGNTLIHLIVCFALSIFVKCRFGIDGDNGLLLCTKRDVPYVRAIFGRLGVLFGLDLIQGDVYDYPEGPELCKAKVVVYGNGPRLVRLPHKVLSGAMCISKSVPFVQLGDYLLTVSIGEGLLYRDVPILGAFWARIHHLFRDCRIYKSKELKNPWKFSKRMWAQDTVTPAVRESFSRAFGIGPELQIAFEDWFSSMDVDLLDIRGPSWFSYAGRVLGESRF